MVPAATRRQVNCRRWRGFIVSFPGVTRDGIKVGSLRGLTVRGTKRIFVRVPLCVSLVWVKSKMKKLVLALRWHAFSALLATFLAIVVVWIILNTPRFDWVRAGR